MNSNPSLGKFVVKSTLSKAFPYISYAILILSILISLFIYIKLIIPITEGRLRFDGGVDILYNFIIFIVAVPLIISYVATYMSIGPLFYLYENGIVNDNKGNTETLYYKDIEDVYLFTSGKNMFVINNIAVRKNNTAEWHIISARYSSIYKVIEFLRSRHVSVSLPLLLNKLKEGYNVDFRYLDLKNLSLKQFMSITTTPYLNEETKTMQVFKDRLVVDSQIIYFKEVTNFSVANQTNEIQLINTGGKIVFKRDLISISSSDSLIALLDILINKK